MALRRTWCDIDWKQIKAEYIAGGTSYRTLAKKYKDEGISFEAIKRRAKNEGWVALRSQAEHKATTDIVNKIGRSEAKKAIKIEDCADKLLDRIAEVIPSIDDTQGIKHIASALKDIKDIKGIKSADDMREQEARIKKLEREAKMGEESTEGSGVVYMPSVDGELRPPEEADDE